MHKNLLALAGLLSLLTVNQVSCWSAPIKNETAKQIDLNVCWKVRTSIIPDSCNYVTILPGQTKNIESVREKSKRKGISDWGLERDLLRIELLTLVGPQQSEIADINFYTHRPKKRSDPLKGLTIKTGSDGKPVAVENQ